VRLSGGVDKIDTTDELWRVSRSRGAAPGLKGRRRDECQRNICGHGSIDNSAASIRMADNVRVGSFADIKRRLGLRALYPESGHPASAVGMSA